LRKKNKKVNEAIIKETLLSLSEEELILLILSSPRSLTNLCILLSLEEQLVEEGKIKSNL
jgi:hypothetical protein